MAQYAFGDTAKVSLYANFGFDQMQLWANAFVSACGLPLLHTGKDGPDSYTDV
jgi:hypothetical protein